MTEGAPKYVPRKEDTIDFEPSADALKVEAAPVESPSIETSEKSLTSPASEMETAGQRKAALASLLEKAPKAPVSETAVEPTNPAGVPDQEKLRVKSGALTGAKIFTKRLFRAELTPAENEHLAAKAGEAYMQKLEQGDIKDAIKLYRKLDDMRFNRKITDEEFVPYDKAFKEVEKRAVLEGDTKTFAAILDQNLESMRSQGPSFTRAELGLAEGQMVDPKIAKLAHEHFTKLFKEAAGKNASSSPSAWYDSHANALEVSGIISRKELDADPVVRKILKTHIVDTTRRMFGRNSTVGNPGQAFENYVARVTRETPFSREEIQGWKEISRLVA